MNPLSRRRRFGLGLLVTLILVSAPLFGRLGNADVDNDEAIYSYAVERILDTGDWLTPRGIPHDGAFLEKPPLKFWLVAGGIRSGLLPRNEFGMRFFDALFGVVACLYVFLIGHRLAGPVCGAVAALALVTIEPLVFDHGLRSNNMEAAVFLSYCGGMYHAARWLLAAPGRAPGHALAVAAYFTLGFMTKFVAAAFLPVVIAVAAVWRPGGLADVRARWRDWLLPSGLVVVAVAPWFAYESWLFGRRFWEVILGIHVYQRFAGILDPNHLNPWHYYFSTLGREVARAGAVLLLAAGTVRLLHASMRGEPAIARLILLWALVPLAIVSFGTSKLLHYAYPFFPPVGLAIGYAATWVLDAAGLSSRHAESVALVRVRRVVLALAVVAAAVAAATAMTGRLVLEWHDVTLLRNSSIWRPLTAAAALLWLWSYGRDWSRCAVGALLLVLLPLGAYAERLHRLELPAHPIRATRDCMMSVDRAKGGGASGILSASGNVLHHTFYYYLWRTGPYVIAPAFDAAAVRERLAGDGARLPVIIRRDDYEDVAASLPQHLGAARYGEEAALFPPPYAACGDAVIAAGGAPIWGREPAAR